MHDNIRFFRIFRQIAQSIIEHFRCIDLNKNNIDNYEYQFSFFNSIESSNDSLSKSKIFNTSNSCVLFDFTIRILKFSKFSFVFNVIQQWCLSTLCSSMFQQSFLQHCESYQKSMISMIFSNENEKFLKCSNEIVFKNIVKSSSTTTTKTTNFFVLFFASLWTTIFITISRILSKLMKFESKSFSFANSKNLTRSWTRTLNLKTLNFLIVRTSMIMILNFEKLSTNSSFTHSIQKLIKID